MADQVRTPFILGVANITTEFIRLAAAWRTFETEYGTFQARNITITQEDLTAAGYPNITPADFLYAANGANMLTKVQAVVNLIQNPTTANLIYRLLK